MSRGDDSELDLEPYLTALREGQVVACATETQIGLLANGLDADAVERVAALKGRSDESPIALLLPNAGALADVAVAVSPAALKLCHEHWPGPLTVLVRARPELSRRLQRDGRVGVRVPGDSAALQLVKAFGGPLTATSANLSGEPAAVTADEARAAFGDGLPVVPADAPGGAPSTVVVFEDGRLRIVRAGAIPVDALDGIDPLA